MRPDEPHIHEPDREFDYGDQAEIVSFDIEHITLVAYIINAIESLFHIREATPFAFLDLLHPILQGHLRFRMSFRIFLNGLFGKNPHSSAGIHQLRCKYTQKISFYKI
jgi:hypothetical protein